MSQAGGEVVLASVIRARAALLSCAGVGFTIDPASVDEAGVRAALRSDGLEAGAAAAALAELKASQVSQRHRDVLVVGADQILECDGAWFDKPVDMDQARADLLALRGRPHRQHSAVCVVRNGALLWHHRERARLAMRDFSERFLDAHLAAAGDSVLDSAGAYQLEGLGAQLFAEIEGDYFAILGLPLLPLLDFLRQHGVVME